MITPDCLRAVRLSRKLSIEAVAGQAGYAPDTVWRMEQGRAVRWQVLVDVAVALGERLNTAGHQRCTVRQCKRRHLCPFCPLKQDQEALPQSSRPERLALVGLPPMLLGSQAGQLGRLQQARLDL